MDYEREKRTEPFRDGPDLHDQFKDLDLKPTQFVSSVNSAFIDSPFDSDKTVDR